ncbi:response regulator receiver protein [Gloeothece citriformis PCC 7424]|uniref:Response regulator receiver protein n=1 Tax=Gloeothece citriformis (strain PCC 7424) TaxID=65393 RepID=B7KGZ8_GLOC7|nr:response regulator [Gloeothece citriformis]ACK73485.1 response regulator receiver protein [Gloeothece citriformis PCC 7424]
MPIESYKILLIENDPNEIELMLLALNSDSLGMQINIDIAINGQQALEYLFERKNSDSAQSFPRLILLDLNIPLISGIEVLRKIRNHPQTTNLIVVVMTSSAEDRDIQTCYNLGVNSYIVKPINFDQYVDVVRQVGIYWMRLNEPPM